MPRGSTVESVGSAAEKMPLFNRSGGGSASGSKEKITTDERASIGSGKGYRAYIDTGYDARDAEERASVHASDSGLVVHAEPEASLTTGAINIVATTVGVGVLAIPLSFRDASLGLGIIMVFVFAVFSSFSSYVLSVACEYTQYFSQPQLLVHCLCGVAPDQDDPMEIYESLDSKNQLHQHQQQQSQSATAPPEEGKTGGLATYGNYSTVMSMPADPSDVLSGNYPTNIPRSTPTKKRRKMKNAAAAAGEEDKNKTDETTGGSPLFPNMEGKSDAINTSKKGDDDGNDDDGERVSSTNNSETDDEKAYFALIDAEKHAAHMTNQVNLILDLVLGLTYFGFAVAYARVVADSMTNVSTDLGLPDFFRARACWLIIAGAAFIALSTRRVFKELKVTSIIAIGTIVFVVLCLIIRFIHPYKQPDFELEMRYFKFDSSFLSAFATLSSAYGYQVNHPAYYQETKDRSPGRMQKSVLSGMVLDATVYILTGTFGYLMFGEGVASKESGGDIVNNFADDDLLINIARFGLFFHFVCVFPLVISAVRLCFHRVGLRVLGLHERAGDPDEVFKVPMGVIAMEVFVLVIAAVIVAGVVPGIGIVINLAGCLGGTFSLMILPGIVGMYIFPELEQRKNDKTVSELVQEIRHNNFFGFCEVAFSNKSYYWLSVVITVIGIISTIGGFVVILQGV